MSRWTNPCAWAWPRASATSATIRADSRWAGRSVLDPGRQVRALDPLDDDEAGPAVPAHVMDRHDVRVPQPGDLAGLDPALVHLARPVTGRSTFGHLHGDGALQPGVEPPVDPPEAARRRSGRRAGSGPPASGAGRVSGRVVSACPIVESVVASMGLVEPIDLAQLLDLPAELVERSGAVPAQLLRRRGPGPGPWPPPSGR